MTTVADARKALINLQRCIGHYKDHEDVLFRFLDECEQAAKPLTHQTKGLCLCDQCLGPLAEQVQIMNMVPFKYRVGQTVKVGLGTGTIRTLKFDSSGAYYELVGRIGAFAESELSE